MHTEIAQDYQPARDEHFHNDDNFAAIEGQKGARARARLGITTAVRLEALSTASGSAIAERLRSCGEGQRCHCGCCPNCMAATGHWSVEQGLRLLAAHSQMLFTTVQLTDSSAIPERLRALN